MDRLNAAVAQDKEAGRKAADADRAVMIEAFRLCAMYPEDTNLARLRKLVADRDALWDAYMAAIRKTGDAARELNNKK